MDPSSTVCPTTGGQTQDYFTCHDLQWRVCSSSFSSNSSFQRSDIRDCCGKKGGGGDLTLHNGPQQGSRTPMGWIRSFLRMRLTVEWSEATKGDRPSCTAVSRSTIVSRASSFSVTSLEEEPGGSPETGGDPRIMRASSWSGGFIGLAVTPEDETNPYGEPTLRMYHTLLLNVLSDPTKMFKYKR